MAYAGCCGQSPILSGMRHDLAALIEWTQWASQPNQEAPAMLQPLWINCELPWSVGTFAATCPHQQVYTKNPANTGV
jgi:hypothetical protein